MSFALFKHVSSSFSDFTRECGPFLLWEGWKGFVAVESYWAHGAQGKKHKTRWRHSICGKSRKLVGSCKLQHISMLRFGKPWHSCVFFWLLGLFLKSWACFLDAIRWLSGRSFFWTPARTIHLRPADAKNKVTNAFSSFVSSQSKIFLAKKIDLLLLFFASGLSAKKTVWGHGKGFVDHGRSFFEPLSPTQQPVKTSTTEGVHWIIYTKKLPEATLFGQGSEITKENHAALLWDTSSK